MHLESHLASIRNFANHVGPILAPFGILLLAACGGGGGNASVAPVPMSVAPSITAQPQSIAVVAAQPATFSVTAVGTAPLNYQWTQDGNNIVGATSATYTTPVNPVQQSGGTYAVSVSNASGRVTSNNAILSVNPSPTTTTMTAVTGTVSAASPAIMLANVVTVDFTGQSSLFGQAISLAQVSDADINALAGDRAIDLDVDLSSPNLIQIAVPEPPAGDVSVTLSAGPAISAAAENQTAAVYIYSSAGDSADGDDTFSALPATVDSADGTLKVSVPGGYFQQVGSGTYIAYLKLGVANVAAVAPSAMQTIRKVLNGGTSASPSPIYVSSGIAIPCPLGKATCIERSRFNPDRYLTGTFRPHYGVDFVAASGTNIFVPSGGAPYHAFTAAQYNAGQLGCPTSKCNGGAGILLAIDYGTYKLRLLHLSSIATTFLNSDGSLNTLARTSSSVTVAQSGNTGVALNAPHLHFEFIAGSTSVCSSAGTNCKSVLNRVDPFPFIASQLTLAEATNQTTLATGSHYVFSLTATDLTGSVSVSSNVQNPGENGGRPPAFGSQSGGFVYDPTRKVCLSSSTPDVLQLPTPDSSTTFAGVNSSYCGPWGTSISATGSAASPSTSVSAQYSSDATVAVAQDPLNPPNAAAPQWQLFSNSWVGSWAGTITSTCGFITGPFDVVIVSDGGLQLTLSDQYGDVYDLTISSTDPNSASSTLNGGIFYTISGNSMTVSEPAACQTGSLTRQ